MNQGRNTPRELHGDKNFLRKKQMLQPAPLVVEKSALGDLSASLSSSPDALPITKLLINATQTGQKG